MAEQTVPAQLSGHEVIEAICDRLRQKLLAYGYPLRAGDCYEWFTAHIEVGMDMLDAGSNQKAAHVFDVAVGVEPPDGTELLHLDTTLDIAKAPPNVVRVETGQAVPTVAKDAAGKLVTKGVQYARKEVVSGVDRDGPVYPETPEVEGPVMVTKGVTTKTVGRPRRQ